MIDNAPEANRWAAAEINRALVALRLSPYCNAEPTTQPGVVNIAYGPEPALLKPHQANVDALMFARYLSTHLPSPEIIVALLDRKRAAQPHPPTAIFD
ncbi:hypothetical protein [Akkermansia glycaniphila]|uniref:Uncharacterized protein n=1 Tax=Akkermansia glycaniphila TaxID=1679444 RepID=A0A1C7PAD9_9BACT|nr:hypothetical protein [Akkermansia glycaniphila]OCA02294.1 hypothetical protein AC781_10710 [Akkermansia glycaniphila]SEH87269.1 Hypothetical protein PYTT_1358 [Akkermansia glycaniphila]